MKKKYEKIKIEIIYYDSEDIIITSNWVSENDIDNFMNGEGLANP